MTEIIEKKKKLFNRVFGMKYSLTLIEMKSWERPFSIISSSRRKRSP